MVITQICIGYQKIVKGDLHLLVWAIQGKAPMETPC